MMTDIFWFSSVAILAFTVFVVAGPRAMVAKVFNFMGNTAQNAVSWVKGLFSR